MRTLLFVVALAALTPPLHAYAGSDKAENCKEAADKKDLEGDDRRKFLRKCSSVGSQRVESCRDVAKNKKLSADERKESHEQVPLS